VRLDVQHDIQMAGNAAARGGLALTGQAQLNAFVGTRRHVDGYHLLGPNDTAPLTLGAWVGDHLTLAVAPVAQRDVDELAENRLLHAADLTAALAPGALGPLAARFHATTRASRAIGVLGQTDLLARPEDRLFEREMQVV